MSKLQIGYDYGTTNNNGNILSQAILVGGTTINQNYSYDQVNRLANAVELGAWSQIYDYDVYGNRAVRNGSHMPNPAITPVSTFAGDLSAFNASTNRISLGGFGYDNTGNLTSDPTTATNGITYDAENRQTSYTRGGVTNSYSYDGNSLRVKKVDTTGTIIFVYNAMGQLIAEYHSDPVPTPPGGGGTSYFTDDHLGSTRLVSKQDGAVKARYDYLPFGEELIAGVGLRTTGLGYNGADSTRQKFTSKERDPETGLDYFGERYCSSAAGRFTSIDSGAIEPIDPQSLNRYVYTKNNPLFYFDPDGEQGHTAKSKWAWEMLTSDPTFLLVITYSKNLSTGEVEDSVKNGALDDLFSGVGNTFRGLAGEAVVADSMREKGALVRFSPDLSPAEPDLRGLYAVCTDPECIFQSYSAVLEPFSGDSGYKVFGKGIFDVYVEVKAGFKIVPKGIERTLRQINNMAAGIKQKGGRATWVLVVDKNAWKNLAQSERIRIFNAVSAGGGHLVAWTGLAIAAKERAQKMIDEGKRLRPKRPPKLKRRSKNQTDID
jgi:RHS repeat-associated protein